jgi:hypothetical protein
MGVIIFHQKPKHTTARRRKTKYTPIGKKTGVNVTPQNKKK